MMQFEDAGYDDATFENIQLKDELEDVEFYNCVFVDSSFQSCRLIGCSFDSCEFVRCNLSLVEIVRTAFLNARFTDCKMLGIAWNSVNGFLTASYDRCILNNNIFSDMNLTKFRFTSCSLMEVLFHNTKLRHAVLDDCDLNGCQFSQADLSFADFTTSRNYYIDARENTLRKTRFSLPEAISLLKNLNIVLE